MDPARGMIPLDLRFALAGKAGKGAVALFLINRVVRVTASRAFDGINPRAKMRRCGLFHGPLTPFPLPVIAEGIQIAHDAIALSSV